MDDKEMFDKVKSQNKLLDVYYEKGITVGIKDLQLGIIAYITKKGLDKITFENIEEIANKLIKD